MERFYIYKLTFESGATYIGQHTQRREDDLYVTSSSYVRKHPEDKLINREIILDNVKDKATLDIMETICILGDKAENPKNVNISRGGWFGFTGGWNKGKPATDSQKRKTSEKMKGRVPWNKGKTLSKEYREKISKGSKHLGPNKGRKFSEETRQKMSKAHKGKHHSEEWNRKVGFAQIGKSKSKESIEKMRQAKLGKRHSEEHKNSIRRASLGSSYWNNGVVCKRFKAGEEPKEGWVRGRLDEAWNKGKKLSEEQRLKMSESMKGRIPWNKGGKMIKVAVENKAQEMGA